MVSLKLSENNETIIVFAEFCNTGEEIRVLYPSKPQHRKSQGRKLPKEPPPPISDWKQSDAIQAVPFHLSCLWPFPNL